MLVCLQELEQMDKDSGTISPIFSVVTGDVMPLSKTDEMLATQNWTLYFPVPGNHDLDAKHKVDSIAAHVRGLGFPHVEEGPECSPKLTNYAIEMPLISTSLIIINTFAKDRECPEMIAHWLDDQLRSSLSQWKLVFGHSPIHSERRVLLASQTWSRMSKFHEVLTRSNATAYFCGHSHDILSFGNGPSSYLEINAGKLNRGSKPTRRHPSGRQQSIVVVDIVPNQLGIRLWSRADVNEPIREVGKHKLQTRIPKYADATTRAVPDLPRL